MLTEKSKGLFFEVSEFSVLAAITSGLDAPFTVESLQESPHDSNADKVRDFVAGLSDDKSRGYIHGHCGIYPKSRFVRRTTLDSPNKAKEPNYFTDLLNDQFRIDPSKYLTTIVNAYDGTDFDLEKGVQNQKELVLCGAQITELSEQQEMIVDYGVYPERMELGTLSSLGGLINYANFKSITMPTLVLEITSSNSNVFIINNEKIDVTRPIPFGLNGMFPVIQKELDLKDEESAKKLFYSDTFDFTEMGPALLNKMLKELQSSTGFYEVQTGQMIGQIFLTLLPKNLSWIHQTLSRSLGMEVLHLDYPSWLQAQNISVSEDVQLEDLDSRWLSLFSLMGNYSNSEDGAN